VKKAQLVVVGAGPGGYAAAFRASDLGLDVALVDADERPGGVCLHRGCIPSKALLHVSRLLFESRQASAWGVRFAEPDIDLERMRAWKDEVVATMASGLEQLVKRRKIDYRRARASFVDSHTLTLRSDDGEEELRFEHALVATGSRPVVPDALDTDDARVMDSTRALALEEVPRRLLVVGGGYVGLELAQVYAALGASVTVVELTGGLLPGVDRDLVAPLERRLYEDLDAICLSTEVEALEPRDEGILARLRGPGVDPERLFDRVLVAVGRRPDIEGLGLENTDVRLTDRGFIDVDARGRTSDASILAIGDIAGEPMLAHKAAREGKVAVEAIVNPGAELDNRAVPAVVFTDPEVAWCGLSETEARERDVAVDVARFPWSASGRARTLGRPDGVTKLVFAKESGRLAGMGVAGAGAGELIAEGVLAVEMGAVAEDLAESIHPHPTLSETVAEAAELFLGRPIHVGPRRP